MCANFAGMGLLGAIDQDRDGVDGRVIVLRDHPPVRGRPDDVLEESARRMVAGTIATAGHGWLRALGQRGRQSVEVAAHSSAPPAEAAAWEDVVETPFHSDSGVVRLEQLSGPAVSAELAIGAPGRYLARVSRRSGDEGDAWCISLWPAADSRPVPRWLKRTSPALRAPGHGWQSVLGFEAFAVLDFLTGTGSRRPDGWIDQPLPPAGRPPAYVCEQLGVESPETRRAVVPLLRAGGLLAETEGGYTAVAEPPAVATRIRPSARAAAELARMAAVERYLPVIGDIAAAAAWAGPLPISGLAQRLLIPPDELGDIFELAEAHGLLAVGADSVTALTIG